jgi:hypothetical protein
MLVSKYYRAVRAEASKVARAIKNAQTGLLPHEVAIASAMGAAETLRYLITAVMGGTLTLESDPVDSDGESSLHGTGSQADSERTGKRSRRTQTE